MHFQRCEFSFEDVEFRVPLGHLGAECLGNTVRRLGQQFFKY